MNYEKHGKYEIHKIRRSKTPLTYFLQDINLDDYIFIKSTRYFKIINPQELEKWAGFFLIKKQEFNEDNFYLWLNWINKNKIDIHYLNKPFPNFNPYTKIKEI